MSHDWQQISDRYGPLVWKVVYRVLRSHSDAADCCQEVMLEAFEKSQQTTINNWGGFLRWIAVRRSIDRLRQRKRHDERIDQFDVVKVAENRSGDSQTSIQELKERLRRELAVLPAEQATAFWLRCVEESSYAEIAEQMSITENKVGVLVHRARKHVRQALNDFCPTEPGA